jgi:thymidylate kinase
MVKKILIEGLDYAGKSTLCKNLVNEFNNEGFEAKYNKGNIIRNCLDDYTRQELYSENSDLMRLNALLTLGPLVDSLAEDSLSGIDYLVQESYIDRTIGYNKAHQIPYFSELLEGLYDRLLQFDVSFFLDADISERRRRYEKRTDERNKYDDMIFQDPERFLEMNETIKESVLRRPNSYVIDTTDSTPNEDYMKALEIIRGIL